MVFLFVGTLLYARSLHQPQESSLFYWNYVNQPSKTAPTHKRLKRLNSPTAVRGGLSWQKATTVFQLPLQAVL
jgi:hypothetical protein